MRALLVIDMQKEGVYGYGAFGGERARGVMAKTVQNIQRLMRAFHEAGHLVVQTKLWITDPMETSLTNLYPGVGIADTPGAHIIDELKDEPCDYVIEKTNYSAFYETPLDECLVQHEIDELFLVGINTDFCVFCTGLDAYYRGYRTFLVSDATATGAGVLQQKKEIERFILFCGHNVITSAALESRIAGAPKL